MAAPRVIGWHRLCLKRIMFETILDGTSRTSGAMVHKQTPLTLPSPGRQLVVSLSPAAAVPLSEMDKASADSAAADAPLAAPASRPGTVPECPLFDARAAALLGVGCGGTPFVPPPFPRHGAQRRTRAAPPGGEHGEHGEDPPLARSEHRGTPFGRAGESYPQRRSSSSLKFRFRGSQATDFVV